MESFWSPTSRQPPPQRGRWRGELSEMAKVFLPKPDYDDPRYRRPDLPPWPHEVRTAQDRAERWAAYWFEPREASEWARRWPNAVPWVAAAFREASISPEAAMTPLWYGTVRKDRRPLAVRVACGDLEADEAIRQLRDAGLAACPPMIIVSVLRRHRACCARPGGARAARRSPGSRPRRGPARAPRPRPG